MGLGALALGGMMGSPAKAAEGAHAASPFAPKRPHFEPKAKRVIHFFMNGGPSQVDTFDPKPMLTKFDGKTLPNLLKTERPTGAGLKSPFAFQKYGECGLEVSELFARTGQFADDLCVIRSMHADVPNHEPSLGLMNCGESRLHRPSLGSWITYGLGSENENLPGYISMCPNGMPTRRTKNWQSAFLPSIYQGTYINTKDTEVDKLVEFIKNSSLDMKQQRRQLDLLLELNDRHLKQREMDQQLDARIQSYELAYRMQMEASDAFDIQKEPESVREEYGKSDFSNGCLLARRLAERGVRFIQVYYGNGQPWDTHAGHTEATRKLCLDIDRPVAALLSDLKRRGMLEDTLVLWGGEFGRTPTTEGSDGRDHNPWGFTVWMAGGGVRGGMAHGATDPFGFKAVENKVHIHDLHATLLHLMGFDHTRLTYRHAGRDYRLTDVFGKVIQQVLS